MPKEGEFWSNDVRKLRSFGEVDRLEDTLKEGVADCVYGLRYEGRTVAGWIELKRLLEWPKRPGTSVRLPHFDLDQVNFLERWGRVGVGSWLLAQVADDYILFRWDRVRLVHLGMPKKNFIKSAALYSFNGHFPAGRILRCLTAI